MEDRQQLVDLYCGRWSDFGNLDICQLWEECYWYVSLQDGCVWHDLACILQNVGDSNWMHCLVNDLEGYWYRVIAHIFSLA